MVTHGYVVFKYKGIYYTFYNHSDSYFEGLGNMLVTEIYNMINKEKVYYYKELLLRVPLKGNEDGEMHVHELEYILKYPEYSQYFTSRTEPLSEYTYTIDFDTDKFIANKYSENIYSFNLYDIPLDWYESTQNNSSYEDSDHDESDEEEIDNSNESILNKIEQLNNEIEKLKLKLK
jgi:hypothetical protein